MRIAIISHIRHPIAPPFMGGMEAHSHSLASELAGRGHKVTLYASGDSVPPAGVRLRPFVAQPYDRVYPWHRFHGTDALNAHLDQAFAAILPELAAGQYDIIHNNSLHRYPPRLARQAGVPMLTSLHVPPFDALRRAVNSGKVVGPPILASGFAVPDMHPSVSFSASLRDPLPNLELAQQRFPPWTTRERAEPRPDPKNAISCLDCTCQLLGNLDGRQGAPGYSGERHRARNALTSQNVCLVAVEGVLQPAHPLAWIWQRGRLGRGVYSGRRARDRRRGSAWLRLPLQRELFFRWPWRR